MRTKHMDKRGYAQFDASRRGKKNAELLSKKKNEVTYAYGRGEGGGGPAMWPRIGVTTLAGSARVHRRSKIVGCSYMKYNFSSRGAFLYTPLGVYLYFPYAPPPNSPPSLLTLRPLLTGCTTYSMHLINWRISFHSCQMLSPLKTGFIVSAHRLMSPCWPWHMLH